MVSAPCLCAIATTTHTRSTCPPAAPAVAWMILLGPLALLISVHSSCGTMGCACVGVYLPKAASAQKPAVLLCGHRDFLPPCYHSPLPHHCLRLSFLPTPSSKVLRTVSYQRLSTSHFTARTAFRWITRSCAGHRATYWHCFLEEILSLDLESQQIEIMMVSW